MENNELETMVKTLEPMMPGLHASVDGKGVFIGNGMPRSKNQALRSQVLANALKELLAWRLELGGAWRFNADKGLLEAVGEYSVDAAPKDTLHNSPACVLEVSRV